MSYQAHVVEAQYKDEGRNSDKFYRCYHIWDDTSGDHRVLFQWGRRGANGQSNVVVCSSEREATAKVLNKLHEKLDKGYLRSYERDLPGVGVDLLRLAGVNDARPGAVSQDPFVRIAVDVDTVRRLAMGNPKEITQAITMRAGLLEQLDLLRTSVANAEGQVEIVDMILSQKVG